VFDSDVDVVGIKFPTAQRRNQFRDLSINLRDLCVEKILTRRTERKTLRR
jgi:hypothetical protein